MENIYNYEKRLKSIKDNIQSSMHIFETNKKLILRFEEECFANNIGMARIVRYLYCLRDIAIWLKIDFSEANIADLKSLVAKIEQMNNYSPRTKYEYRATIKKFYKWLKNTDKPEEVAWLKLSFKKHNNKLPSDLPNEEDITKMLNYTKNPRDRAIIISIYESGCRVGEFIKLRIKDVSFGKSYWGYFNVKRISRKTWLISLARGLTYFFVILAVFFIIKEFIDFPSIIADLENRLGITAFMFLFVGLYVTFFNSLLEESFFRGFIFLELFEDYPILANIYSSLLFAVYHLGIILTWAPLHIILISLVGLFVVGFIFCLMDIQSKSIVPSWMIHAFADAGIIVVGLMLFGWISF